MKKLTIDEIFAFLLKNTKNIKICLNLEVVFHIASLPSYSIFVEKCWLGGWGTFITQNAACFHNCLIMMDLRPSQFTTLLIHSSFLDICVKQTHTRHFLEQVQVSNLLFLNEIFWLMSFQKHEPNYLLRTLPLRWNYAI